MSVIGPLPSEVVMRRITWATMGAGIVLLLGGLYTGERNNWVPGFALVVAAAARWFFLHRGSK